MASITLKDIPEELYVRLKERARRHHRSIAGEALHCLEQVLKPEQQMQAAHLRRIRKLRSSLRGEFDADEILRAIDEGRA